MTERTSDPRHEERWVVVCLCAAWCHICGALRPGFDARAAMHPQLEHRWIDIEDEADAVGDLDVETFPTLLVLRGGEPLFYGPVLPRPEAIDALIAALRADPTPRTGLPAELGPLLKRLAQD